MPKCLRCGACCHFFKDGELKPCRFLCYYGKYAFCRIYPNRIGTLVADGVYCDAESPFNWPYCPYNSSGKKTITS